MLQLLSDFLNNENNNNNNNNNSKNSNSSSSSNKRKVLFFLLEIILEILTFRFFSVTKITEIGTFDFVIVISNVLFIITIEQESSIVGRNCDDKRDQERLILNPFFKHFCYVSFWFV